MPPEGYNFRAIAPINFGFTRAFNAGDPVPDSTVEREGLLEAGLVERDDFVEPDAVPFDAARAAVDLASIATSAPVGELATTPARVLDADGDEIAPSADGIVTLDPDQS